MSQSTATQIEGVIFIVLVVAAFAVFQQPFEGLGNSTSNNQSQENKSVNEAKVSYEFTEPPEASTYQVSTKECRSLYEGGVDQLNVKAELSDTRGEFTLSDIQDQVYWVCGRNEEGAILKTKSFGVTEDLSFSRGSQPSLRFRAFNFDRLVDVRDYRLELTDLEEPEI